MNPNSALSNGVLYYLDSDGVYQPIGEFESVDIETESDSASDYIPFLDDLEFSFTAHISPSKLLRVYGKSNNWLKMHGYPMIRRRAFFQALKSTK
jgi:hypothetical protein